MVRLTLWFALGYGGVDRSTQILQCLILLDIFSPLNPLLPPLRLVIYTELYSIGVSSIPIVREIPMLLHFCCMIFVVIVVHSMHYYPYHLVYQWRIVTPTKTWIILLKPGLSSSILNSHNVHSVRLQYYSL